MSTAFDALLVAIGEEGQADQPWFLKQQQRFFIAAASAWQEKSTEEFLHYLVTSDVHSPETVRGVRPVRNMDQFFEAFAIDEGVPKYLPPEERIVIW